MHLGHSILKTLAYFDLFNYPLTEEEILYFLDRPVASGALSSSLQALLKEGCIFREGRFYSLRNDPELVRRRLKDNSNAQRLLAIAATGSRFLFRFPYVRGIGISGSLSKNCAAHDADIDYFVITSPNRLWIARTLMHLFKKLSFLAGRQDRYCMNYYVDEEALKIEEMNIFTAIELVTLLPACGNGTLDKFFDSNGWAFTYFPNYGLKNIGMKPTYPRSWIKTLAERLLNNRLGDKLDDFLLGLTTRRWEKKARTGAVNKKGDPMTLLTGKHFSKPDPVHLQARIIRFYNDKLKGLQTRWPDHFPH
jgi:hypothetical protein